MGLHNMMEEMVITRVNEIFDTMEKSLDNMLKYCACDQCRMDIVCYTLNRVRPYYIMSNRGVSRIQREIIEHQQEIADIATLIHEGLRQVNHNRRPNFAHGSYGKKANEDNNTPVFNIPVIMGRIYDGNKFAPISDAKVDLLYDGELLHMKDGNWQNPYHMVSNTEGTFSFWPVAAEAASPDEEKVFEYTLRVTSGEFEELTHIFKVPVTSEAHVPNSFDLKRTYKIPNLYMFHPGEGEKSW